MIAPVLPAVPSGGSAHTYVHSLPEPVVRPASVPPSSVDASSVPPSSKWTRATSSRESST